MQRLVRRARPSVAAVGAAAATLFGTQSSSEGAVAEAPPGDARGCDCPSVARPHSREQDSALPLLAQLHRALPVSKSPSLLASSPIGNASGAQDVSIGAGAPIAKEGTRIECDYVIIGHGKAGRSAVRTIRQLDPSAHIIIIDPNNSERSQRSGTAKRGGVFRSSDGSVKHLPTRAGHIDHSKKLIRIHPIAQNSNEDTTVGAVHYCKSALIATGSRGAPPPESCIRPDAYSRILELRSTTLPPAIQSPRIANGQSQPAIANGHSQSTSLDRQQSSPMPVLDPPTVRSLSIMAASQGAMVAVMGSGLDALELAAACARASPNASDRASNGAKADDAKVLLLFGNSSPMSNRLPRYLGAAVTKRLRQFGIGVEDRALTRYISMDTMGPAKKSVPSQLEIYAVKSYDHLDSIRANADLLVLAPNVDGMNGTAVVPTCMSTSSQSTGHLPWSSLISPPLLTCYLDDGRIATNSEFHAASSLFAAGSVARYPDPRTGRAEVAGGRHVSSEQAGEAAARSMVCDGGGTSTQQSIPVWRSDVVSYLLDDSSSTQALYSMGIHALCVGKCDSEGMATHGFWWTNTNSSSESKNGNGSKSNGGKSIGPNAFMRRATRKSNSPGSKSGKGSLPVYGSGVVFYLDRSGNVEGILLWGLPFSQDPKDGRMKAMIRSNGGVAIHEHSTKILDENPGANLDVTSLSYLHLAAESKRLASMALSGSSLDEHQMRRNDAGVVRGRPLHRYTPTKSMELTNLGKLARRNESGHLVEEDDLFYTTKATSDGRVDEAGRPPSLKRVYPMSGGLALVGTEEHERERELERRRLRIERSRPPKEEPLWLRQGEESRYQNRRDVWADSFLRNIQAGRFSDGSDSVKQAPVPKAYLDAKERWETWTGGDSEGDGAEE
ncbi:hypothetical protein ACHAXT_012471 [Thalassiosira profunda]